ncbi:MAG: hypothetical protein SFY95_04805 [Planctomycetota bacterium]|nr:hypothetical protein [Planctomycetota bacterium]
MLVLVLVAAVLFDVWLPTQIPWEPARLASLPALRADGLVLQDERADEVWATRGYGIYRSRGSDPFERIAILAPRIGPAWAGFSRTFRDTMRYQELVEVMVLDDGTLLAFAGGDVYRVDRSGEASGPLHRLRYFGPGRGRGLMPQGLTRDSDGAIYYGEYPTGAMAPGETVRVWRSLDEARTWEVAYEFPPGAVRHVHAVQWDPVGRALWVATGDEDAECRVGYSQDGGATFRWVGSGSQRFRAVSFLFTREAVLWAMDTLSAERHVVRWDRASNAISESATALPDAGYYATGLDDETGLVSLGETGASLWRVEDGEPSLLHAWRVVPDPRRPHPVVRLLRRAPTKPPEAVFLNPLRTETESAAIYRIEAAAVLSR